MWIIIVICWMYENRERRDFEIRKNNKIYISNLSSSVHVLPTSD